MDKIFHRDSDLTCLQKVSFLLLAFFILNVFLNTSLFRIIRIHLKLHFYTSEM